MKNIFGLASPFERYEMIDETELKNHKRIQEKIIRRTLSTLFSKRKEKVTLEHLLYFRDNYRKSFLEDVFFILDEVEKEKTESNKIIFAEELSKKVLKEGEIPGSSKYLVRPLQRLWGFLSLGSALDDDVRRTINNIWKFFKKDTMWQLGMLQEPPKSYSLNEMREISTEVISRVI